jgi:hypothetical protein
MFPPFELRRNWRIAVPAEDIVTARYVAEFSRSFEVARVRDRQVRVRIAATDAECAGLAVRLGLLALERLEAEAVLTPAASENGIHLAVDWVADVVQSCVVSLEPVASRLNDSFGLLYAPAQEPREFADVKRNEVQIDIDGRDPPEPLIGDRIDVGEAIAEQLALALDVYPRRPGASILTEYVIGQEDTDARQMPFATLAELAVKR